MNRVVITGMGALTPIGNNVNEFWESLKAGKSGAAPITKFNTEKFKTKFACEVKNLELTDYLPKPEIRKYDPFVQYALVAVDEAVRHAGLQNKELDANRIGVIWGSGNGGFTTFEEQVTEFGTGDGTPRFNPYFIPKVIPNMASGIIAMKQGFKGINFTTVSACAASNTAMMDAYNYIRLNKADIIISGGSEAPISATGVGGFSAMKALSSRNDDPEKASRPFDRSRDGFVMGEGAGAIVLESLDHAIARGATIYAEIIGASMTADAYHLSASHPEGEGASRAMRLAMEEAGITPNDIDYVNTHATSTSVGDISEIKALSHVFNEKNEMVVAATKSMTGHLLGAAGAIEGIASVMSILHDIVPPTINCDDLDDSVPEWMNIARNEAVIKPVNIAMSNTFGFGGHNAIVIFRKYAGS